MLLDCDGHDLDVGEGEKALLEESGLRGDRGAGNPDEW